MTAAAGIGHNRGPEMTGLSWRSHCWSQARRNLLPVLPVEVVRLRVKRAAELGLDYKTYAGIRASTGNDLVAFLFSSNALRIFRATTCLPQDRQEKLAAIAADKLGLATAPLTPRQLGLVAPTLTETHQSPSPLASFAEARQGLRVALGKRAADTVLLIGDHALEAEWCAAGRLAGYLPAERFFTA